MNKFAKANLQEMNTILYKIISFPLINKRAQSGSKENNITQSPV